MDNNFERRITKQVLMEWITSGRPLDKICFETFREHRVGANQRPYIQDRVYRIVRWWGTYISWDSPNPAPLPEQLRELDKALDDLDLSVDALTVHERAKPRFDKDPLEHLARIHRVDRSILKTLPQQLGVFHEFLHGALSSKAPLTLRRNSFSSDTLSLDGLQKHPVIRDAYWTQNDVSESSALEIQDESSQVVSWMASPKPGERVLDLCAGGGGKTLHVAALMQNKGDVVATDISAKRLAPTAQRAKRAGLTNVRILEQVDPSKNVGEKFDMVLIDAPCSGLGTLRRNPERLLSLDATEMKRLSQAQEDLLSRALPLLKPGGRLVYSVCCVLPLEGVERFLRFVQSAKLIPVDLRPAWSEMTSGVAVSDASGLGNTLERLASAPAWRLASTFAPSPAAALQAGWIQLGFESPSTKNPLFCGDGFFVGVAVLPS